MKNRVVITGLGIISPIGINIKEFWTNCLLGKSNIEKIPSRWFNYSNFTSQIWSTLPQNDIVCEFISKIEEKQFDKTTIMSLNSVFQALNNAGLKYEQTDKKRNTYLIKELDSIKSGVFIGTGIGGISTLGFCFANQLLSSQNIKLNELIKQISDEKIIEKLNDISGKMIFPKRFNPFAVSMIMSNASAANIGIKLNLKGLNNTYCAACASGTVAIGHAYKSISRGDLDFTITGGTEFMFDDYGALFYAFDAIRALTKNNNEPEKANRPFDRDRTGFLYSQGGAGILILEELNHAINRGADIIAEIAGYAENCDAYNIMMIEESGENIKSVIKKALDDAKLSENEIDYINTHGTGTPLNDEVESKIIEDLFGKKPLINSTKSLVGHTLGASGAIEAIVTALSIKNKTSHICKNLDNPIRDLNFITKIDKYPIKNALTQSFGFGGHNSVLIIKEYEK